MHSGLRMGPSSSCRSHLKEVFWLDLGVGRSFQILEIQGVLLRSQTRGRLDLEPKSNFEMASKYDIKNIFRK